MNSNYKQPHCKATSSLTARPPAASLQGHQQPHCKAMDRQPHCKATSMHSSRTGRIGQAGQGRHEHRNLYFLGQTLARSLNFSSSIRAAFITNELLATSHACAKCPHPYIGQNRRALTNADNASATAQHACEAVHASS